MSRMISLLCDENYSSSQGEGVCFGIFYLIKIIFYSYGIWDEMISSVFVHNTSNNIQFESVHHTVQFQLQFYTQQQQHDFIWKTNNQSWERKRVLEQYQNHNVCLERYRDSSFNRRPWQFGVQRLSSRVSISRLPAVPHLRSSQGKTRLDHLWLECRCWMSTKSRDGGSRL